MKTSIFIDFGRFPPQISFKGLTDFLISGRGGIHFTQEGILEISPQLQSNQFYNSDEEIF